MLNLEIVLYCTGLELRKTISFKRCCGSCSEGIAPVFFSSSSPVDHLGPSSTETCHFGSGLCSGRCLGGTETIQAPV